MLLSLSAPAALLAHLALPELPDLATHSPAWLSITAVFVNAFVGALLGLDGGPDKRQWDIMGMTVFALLMGLGGGFIRDVLIGNLPAESLRSSRYLITVIVAVIIARLVGRRVRPLRLPMAVLDALALGLFAITGTAYTIERGLPWTSAVLVGTASAVGGGMLVSVLRQEVPRILVASTPYGLLAVLASAVYLIARELLPNYASLIAIAVLVLARFITWRWGWQTSSMSSPKPGTV